TSVVLIIAKLAHDAVDDVVDRSGEVAGVVDRDAGRGPLALPGAGRFGREVGVALEPAAPRVSGPGRALRPVISDPFLVVQLGDGPGDGRRLQVDDAVAGLIALVRAPDIVEDMLGHLDGAGDRLGQIGAADAGLGRFHRGRGRGGRGRGRLR